MANRSIRFVHKMASRRIPNDSLSLLDFQVQWGSTKTLDARQLTHEVINPAYAMGEHGILKPPIQRASVSQVTEWLEHGQLLVVVVNGNHHKPGEKLGCYGCVRVETEQPQDAAPRNDAYRTIHVGCLAVHPEYQGQGLARTLMDAVEDFVKRTLAEEPATGSSKSTTSMEEVVELELEVLAPTQWRHDHKERVRQWFTVSRGFQPISSEPQPEGGGAEEGILKAGTVLVPGASGDSDICLATDARFWTYRKYISRHDDHDRASD